VSSGQSRRPSGQFVFLSVFGLIVMACGPRHVRQATITDQEDAGSEAAAPPPGTGGDGGSGAPPDASAGSGGTGGSGGSGGTPLPDAARDTAPPPADRAADLPRDVAADLPPPVDTRPPPPDVTPDQAGPDGPPPPDLTAGLVGHWKFDEGTGTTTADASGKGNTGVLNAGVMWTAGAPFPGNSGAISFDGSSAEVTLRQNLAPVLGSTATLAFWIRTTQKGNDTAHDAPGVTGIEQADGSNDVFWGFIDAAGGIGVAAGNAVGVHSDPISDDQWHHVALTRDVGSGRVQVYVDGKLIRSGATVAGAKTTAFTVIGRIANAGRLKASLDDLRVWNRIVSGTDLAYLATH
jgi:hypothetical protein